MPGSLPEQIEQIARALTAPEVAKYLNVDKLTIYRLAKAGVIPSFRIASSVRFDPKSVAKYLRSHEVGA